MPLVAVSMDTIRANVIIYFHNEFGDPISWFKGSTNVRKAYRYTGEQWEEVGPTLSRLGWMRRLNVKLLPEYMPPLKTIDDLTNAIWGKLNKVISVSGARPRPDAKRIRTLAAPKRTKAKAGRTTPKRASKPRSKEAKMKRPRKSRR